MLTIVAFAFFSSNSAFEVGYPAAYVCDETIKDATPYIHSSKDTYDTLEFDHILQHTKVCHHHMHICTPGTPGIEQTG